LFTVRWQSEGPGRIVGDEMPAWRGRPIAAATSIVFATGMLVIPTFHLAFHALPHDHDAGELHYHAAADGEDHHHHEDGEDFATHEREDHHPNDRPLQPLDPHHGDGSAAHFAVAISDAPVAAVELWLAGLVEQGSVIPAYASSDVLSCAGGLRYRGPPPSAL
jgi:hypothetical protein